MTAPRKDFVIPLGKEPLVDYPWLPEIDRLIDWAKQQDTETRCFAFDIAMSLAFIDATSGLERFVEYCPNPPHPYNLHLGFINLCSPCYEKTGTWIFQKAAKPLSGALGKLSSEVILRFVLGLSDNLESVKSVGGVNSIDAILVHKNGLKILAEVKSAPLVTYPVLFRGADADPSSFHTNPGLTTSQLSELDSALYLHDQKVIPLGQPRRALWPFSSAIDYITDAANRQNILNAVQIWVRAKAAYASCNRNDAFYYLANASGQPPIIAVTRDDWPRRESISDSKTSAGMDRTDDIKKGIYQVLKIGAQIRELAEAESYKTAIISNLPAYRHGEEYVQPFVNMLWGIDADLESNGETQYIGREKLRRVFDYIISLENPTLRSLEL